MMKPASALMLALAVFLGMLTGMPSGVSAEDVILSDDASDFVLPGEAAPEAILEPAA